MQLWTWNDRFLVSSNLWKWDHFWYTSSKNIGDLIEKISTYASGIYLRVTIHSKWITIPRFNVGVDDVIPKFADSNLINERATKEIEFLNTISELK